MFSLHHHAKAPETSSSAIKVRHRRSWRDAVMNWQLNILDIVMVALTTVIIIVTLRIAHYVHIWDRRNLRDALLWELCKDHWRTAIALKENGMKPVQDQFSKAEVDIRVKMIERTS